MKSFFCNTLVIISLLVVFTSCGDQRSSESKVTKENKSQKKKEPGKIVFDKEIHNFGTLKDGEIVTFSFVFRNMGGSPITIVKAEKSCGCVETRYSVNSIKPGEKSFIEVQFNSSGEWGNQLKGVTIETSEGEQKELQIGAYVENKQFNNLLYERSDVNN